MVYTTTWVSHRDCTKASLTFEITNFAAAVAANKKGQWVVSQPCTIGGSRFVVRVFPSGDDAAAKDKVSVYVRNKNDHQVLVDFAIQVGDVKLSETNIQMGRTEGWGWTDFMDIKAVGHTLTLVADFTLLKEEVRNVDKGDMDKIHLKEAIKEVVDNMMEEMEAKMKLEIAKIKEPVKIPECPVCFEELRPPLQIISCLRGHKLCKRCSEKEEVRGCPDNCKAGFMGRDLGMEAFVRRVLGQQE